MPCSFPWVIILFFALVNLKLKTVEHSHHYLELKETGLPVFLLEISRNENNSYFIDPTKYPRF